MRVAVLGGGRSSEHDISLESSAAVRSGLEQAGHEVVDVRLERDGRWTCAGEPVVLEPGQGLLRCDAVFPVLHGPFGEDGTVQGLLELLDVPYAGAGVLASALCMDKVTFKDLMRSHGVPQVDYVALRRGDRADAQPPIPSFVKPSRLGSSVGISKVTDEQELDRALAEAWKHDPLVIVEAMSDGLEVECAVMGNGEPVASVPGEIVIEADWYDYEAKYTPGGMELMVPARIDDAVKDEVRELATRVYALVDCAGFARVDFFVEDGGRVLVNELNTIPGFTPTSVFAKLFDASGVEFPDLVDRLVTLAVERHEEERRYRF
jgi:D-alanine-D-alanine ligase